MTSLELIEARLKKKKEDLKEYVTIQEGQESQDDILNAQIEKLRKKIAGVNYLDVFLPSDFVRLKWGRGDITGSNTPNPRSQHKK